jgi:hypothetical protein
VAAGAEQQTVIAERPWAGETQLELDEVLPFDSYLGARRKPSCDERPLDLGSVLEDQAAVDPGREIPARQPQRDDDLNTSVGDGDRLRDPVPVRESVLT